MNKTAMIFWLLITPTLGLFLSLNLIDIVKVEAVDDDNSLAIVKPENITYSMTDVKLEVDEKGYFAIWYNLDGEEDVYLNGGKTTLENLSEGSHSLIVHVWNLLDGEVSSRIVFSVDTIPPEITITSPQETTYSTSEVILDFELSEPVNWIAYSLDNEDNITISGDTFLTDLKDGEHTAKIFARDTAGNTGESDTVTFKVDTIPPEITITSPQETTYTTTNVFINFTLNEKATWISFSLDDENNVTITENTVLYNFTEGVHSIVVFATDNAGNTGASSAVEFTISIPPVDTTRPIILITSPQETTYSTSEIDFKFTINEPVSWRAYSLDGKDNITINETTVLSGLSEGSHNIVVYATDIAGNTGASNVVQFIISTPSVDTTPPEVNIRSPENTTYNTNEVFLTFTVNEEPTQKFYSLDGNTNITAVQPTLISDLSAGDHTLIMYAQDSTGNIGASQQVTFTITESNGEGQLWIVGVMLIIPAFIGLMFSIYIAHDLIKIRRKQIENT